MPPKPQVMPPKPQAILLIHIKIILMYKSSQATLLPQFKVNHNLSTLLLLTTSAKLILHSILGR